MNGEPVAAADVNTRLAELTGEHSAAKDFRTWQGTLVAFRHLRGELDSERLPERVAVDALNGAARVLGNTRAVARTTSTRTWCRRSRAIGSPPISTPAGFRETTIWTTSRALFGFLRVMLEREFDLGQRAPTRCSIASWLRLTKP